MIYLHLAPSRVLSVSSPYDSVVTFIAFSLFSLGFYVPDSLRELIYFNQELLYNLMYDAASKTLIDLSNDKLGVIPGFSLVLHTWSQTLMFHLGCIGEQ